MMDRPLCILCDIDGTIALRGGRGPHEHDKSMEDAPNWPVIQLLDSVKSLGALILISGRKESNRDVTEYWLRTHRILEYRELLLMRKDGDNRADEIVKREIYEKRIAPGYRVLCAIDDRNKVVKMWREVGLLCLQVADGDF